MLQAQARPSYAPISKVYPLARSLLPLHWKRLVDACVEKLYTNSFTIGFCRRTGLFLRVIYAMALILLVRHWSNLQYQREKEMKFVRTLAIVAAVVATQGASAAQLISNGGFESGLSAWTVTDVAGGSGSWYAASGSSGPLSGLSTVGPFAGSGYALTDQTGPGTHALTQSFTVSPGASSVMLTFNMFVNSYADLFTNGGVLNHTGDAVQFGRVDILTAGAGAFDTGAGVIGSLFSGIDAGTNPNPYAAYSFDITSLVSAGGTFQLRFAESDNQLFFNMGVDNVSIDAESGAVPEPGSLILISLGLFGMASLSKRKHK